MFSVYDYLRIFSVYDFWPLIKTVSWSPSLVRSVHCHAKAKHVHSFVMAAYFWPLPRYIMSTCNKYVIMQNDYVNMQGIFVKM